MKKTAHLAFLMNTDTLPDPIMDTNEDYSVVARGEHDHIFACALVLAAMGIDYLQQDTLLLVETLSIAATCNSRTTRARSHDIKHIQTNANIHVYSACSMGS